MTQINSQMTNQQRIQLVQKSKKILIMPSSPPDGDSIGSALALFLAFKKLDKEVTVVCADPIPDVYSFLPSHNVIDNQLDFMRRSGYPENNGLCETGIIIRKNTEQVRTFNEDWYVMITLYSLRDQVSFNYSGFAIGR